MDNYGNILVIRNSNIMFTCVMSNEPVPSATSEAKGAGPASITYSEVVGKSFVCYKHN